MALAPVKRRDFLLLRLEPHRDAIELSCEQLFMKYVDAQIRGDDPELFARLARELDEAREVRLVDTAWLARDDFRTELTRALDAFRARGGRLAIEP